MTQVYIPFAEPEKVAKCLDNRRLNCQIKEATQVYSQNKYGFGGQGNPSPYQMWSGYEDFLGLYIVEMYKEWKARLIDGKRGGVLLHKSGEYILSELDLKNFSWANLVCPHWIDDERIYSSYRSALLFKDFGWYSQFGWTEKPAIPTKIDKKGNVTLPYFYRLDKE